MADSLLGAGNFDRAALEYERVIFRASNSSDVNNALFGRINSFKKMQQFDKAAQELLRIRLFTLNQEQMLEYFYEKILCNYLSGSFIEARGAIDEMYLNIPDSTLCHATLIIQIFVYNELQQWDLARQTALYYSATLSSPENENMNALIESLYANKNLPKLKSQKVSNVLAFVPGLAHIYAGEWVEGSVSFFLNSAVLAFGAYQILNGYYLTGYLLGAGILSATYFGGFNRSAYLLQLYNQQAVSLFNSDVREKLLVFLNVF